MKKIYIVFASALGAIVASERPHAKTPRTDRDRPFGLMQDEPSPDHWLDLDGNEYVPYERTVRPLYEKPVQKQAAAYHEMCII